MAAPPDPGLDLRRLNDSFRLSLHGENKSERTVEAYTDAVRFFADFLEANGHTLTVTAITRDQIRGFIADQLKRWKPATAHNRYRGLHSFFKWAVAEGDLGTSRCWVRVAGPASCRSAARPPRHSTAICGPGRGTAWPTCLISGLAATGP